MTPRVDDNGPATYNALSSAFLRLLHLVILEATNSVLAACVGYQRHVLRTIESSTEDYFEVQEYNFPKMKALPAWRYAGKSAR